MPRKGGKKYSSFVIDQPSSIKFIFDPDDPWYRKELSIVKTIPKSGAQNVGIDRSIEIFFSSPIDSSYLSPDYFILQDFLGNSLNFTFSEISKNENKVVIDPDTSFDSVSKYTLFIKNGFASKFGSTLTSDVKLHFSTSSSRVKKILFDEFHDEYNSISWECAFEIEAQPIEYNKSYFGRFNEDISYDYYITRNDSEELLNDLLQHYDILILSAIRSPLSDNEINNIVQFINDGGNLLILTQFEQFESLNKLVSNFGISIVVGLTISDDTGGWFNMTNFVTEHEILKNVKTIHFNWGGCLDIVNTSNAVPIVYSPSNCWCDLNWNQQKDPTESYEQLLLMASSTYGKGKVVCYTDNSFADGWNFWDMNGRLMLNILNWFPNKPDIPSEINLKKNVSELPSNFYLYQNYPNPFNSEAIIKYKLPQTTEIEITLNNSLGQKVKTLVNTKQNAGYHQIIWDEENSLGNQVSSGLYFIRMKSKDINITRKLLLIR